MTEKRGKKRNRRGPAVHSDFGTPERERLLEDLLAVAPKLYRDSLPPVLLHDDFSHHNVSFDPASLDLRHTVPMQVPSGLPVFD